MGSIIQGHSFRILNSTIKSFRSVYMKGDNPAIDQLGFKCIIGVVKLLEIFLGYVCRILIHSGLKFNSIARGRDLPWVVNKVKNYLYYHVSYFARLGNGTPQKRSVMLTYLLLQKYLCLLLEICLLCHCNEDGDKKRYNR